MGSETEESAPLSRWWALPMAFLGGAITFGTHQIAPMAQAEGAGICSAVLFIVTISIWKYHRESWFWPFVLITIIVEALAIWLIPWPRDHQFEKSDLMFVWLDFFLLFGVLILIDRFIRRKEATGD